MPTSAGSDVIPLRKTTKETLASVKGRASYDDVLVALMSGSSPEHLRLALEGRQERYARAAEARRSARLRARAAPRSAEKQLLIARLAETRWKQWLEQGRVIARGPRLFDWRTDIGRKKVGISVEWQP